LLSRPAGRLRERIGLAACVGDSLTKEEKKTISKETERKKKSHPKRVSE